MANIATHFPLRQALNYALKQLLLNQWVDPVNAALTAQIVAAPGGYVPQFSDANIFTGDDLAPATVSLSIVGIGQRNIEIATGLFNAVMTTHLRLKAVQVADSDPEDFEAFKSICMDSLNDLLTSLAAYTITPVVSDGSGLLPSKPDGAPSSFLQCVSLGWNAMSFPGRSADTVTRYEGAMLMHRACYQYSLSRPGVLGT